MHGEYVLSMVDSVMRRAGMDRSDLDIVAFSAGPASFTGVRIGGSVAQGLAFAVGAKVVAVPSSQVVAESVRLATGMTGVRWLSRPSRVGWCYLARYRFSKTTVECLDFDRLTPAAQVDEDVIDCSRLAVSPCILAAVAAKRMATATSPARALPYYVEGDSPWRVAGGEPCVDPADPSV